MERTTKFVVNQRVSHALEPDMHGTVLNVTSELQTRYLVKWDGGVSQLMWGDQIKSRR